MGTIKDILIELGTNIGAFALDGGTNKQERAKSVAEALEQIEQLIDKAKPRDYVPKNHEATACLNHERYTSTCCGCQKAKSRVQALDEYEGNLKKVLK